MSRPGSTFPPLPPSPPDPPFPRHTPWLPDPRPTAPGPVSAAAWLLVSDGDRLAERLLDQRMVLLAGELDDDAVNRAVAALALLDASGDDPVQLRMSGVSADVDAALPIVDALDLMGAPVHATALGRISGPAVVLLAVADRRVAGAHAVLHLCEPRSPHGIPGPEVEAWAAERTRRLRALQERLAAACGRTVDEIAADMRAGRVLDAQEAREYGLVDAAEPPGRAPTGPAR
jgi:ATP-dependent Clp protease, protease subunit